MTPDATDRGLRAHLCVERDRFVLDVELTAHPGEVVALLGPNGAGKSTALAALAGLLPLTAGRVVLDGRTLDAPADGVLVPARDRRVGVVFQDHLLFAHLSVRENVAFGPRARGIGRAAARATADAWLARLGLEGLGPVRPTTLSGGQAQRVALARALATEPALLLLDAPLAALDAATRLAVRAELRRHLAANAGPTVLVTHDPIDAMVLADRVVVLEAGHVVQEGPPADVAQSPHTDYVARLVGLNLLRGHGTGTTVTLAGGGTAHTADDVSGPVLVAFAPSAVALHPEPPHGSPRNVWPGRVTGLERHGTSVRVQLDGRVPLHADVTPAAVADLDLAPGVQVWAAVKAAEVRAYPA